MRQVIHESKVENGEVKVGSSFSLRKKEIYVLLLFISLESQSRN